MVNSVLIPLVIVLRKRMYQTTLSLFYVKKLIRTHKLKSHGKRAYQSHKQEEVT